ncbi:MAG TPA: potassium-transporting ATPase subunit KdpA, partial [Candidatus Binatia bacterium]|nr:potassium-transporting ATPase subunit KdpA [Candidatus Binatia bacterium]
MTLNGWLQILFFSALILAITKPLGVYMFRVFEGDRQPLPRFFGPIERLLYRLCGVDPRQGQDWKAYTLELLIFSAVTLLVTYAIQRLQQILPLNPQSFGPVAADQAFNTASSFTTNTNWQSYTGESTMGYLTQMAALAWHNFLSAGAGICVLLALARGLTYRLQPGENRTLGNFWVDLTRSILYVYLPICIPVALLLVAQGAIQNFSPYIDVTTLEGARQTIPMGPVASQEVIKELGNNGGGFFNANSAHPFENPTPFTNLIEMLLIFAIPAALTYMYGRMARSQRQGWTIFAAMTLLYLVGVTVAYKYETTPNLAVQQAAVDQSSGNLEGKETRFGVANSALFATITTATSTGAVNSMHDSFTPLGGLVPLANIQLG